MESRTRPGTGKEIVKFIRRELMTKIANPILSLAVVMALALAAVFGAMSLTGTAQAAVDQSASVELSERAVNPQRAPGGFSATPSGDQVTLSWNANGDATGYNLQLLASGENQSWQLFPSAPDDTEVEVGPYGFTLDAAADAAVEGMVTGLTNGTQYCFRLQVVTATGISPHSEKCATPNAAPAITGLHFEEFSLGDDGGTIDIEWDWDGRGADRWQYRVRDASDATGNAIRDWTYMEGVGGNDDTYTISGLNSVTALVDIRAVSEYTSGNVNTGPHGTDGSTTTEGLSGTNDTSVLAGGVKPVPAMPTGFEVEPGNKQITLKWDDPDNSGITRWEYNRKEGDSSYVGYMPVTYTLSGNMDPDTTDTDVDDPMATEATIMGLKNGSTYTFQLRAITSNVAGDADVEGDESMEMSAMPVEPTKTVRIGAGMEDPPLLGVGARITRDLNDYYMGGAGEGAVDEFEVEVAGESATVTGLTAATRDGNIVNITKNGMIAIVGLSKGITVVTVTPVDSEFDIRDQLFTFTVTVGEPDAVVPPVPDLKPSIAALSSDPGKTTRYTIMFKANGIINAGSDELVIELEDFGFPSSMSASDVTIRVHSLGFNEPSNPESVTVAGKKLRIVLGDTNPDTDTIEGISMGDNVTVTIAQGAGLSNPTEGKSGKYVAKVTGGGLKEITTAALNVPLIIELSEEDGGRGDMLTLIGRGFKNGHTMTFWLDRNMNNVPGESGEAVLCSATVSDDDTATCSFEVNNPPFKSGLGVCDGAMPNCNFINGYDGAGNRGSAISGMGATAKIADSGLVDDQNFELKAAISISPQTGSVGDTIQVQMSDFPADATVTAISIAGFPVSPTGSVNAEGNGSFSFVIPNSVPQGIEKLAVFASNAKKEEADADTKLIIGGPGIRVTPGTVLANQRVSVVASGFTAGARICCVDPDGPDTVHRMPEIKVGNVVIPAERINGGQRVTVDNGGSWSASINLPFVKALTEEGTKELRVTDSRGRVGTAEVTIPARTIEVTPLTGRVGSIAVVRGEGFPSRNDEGDSFGISIVYQASTGSTTTVSATPDASGRFEVQLRVPTGAAIPSTNTILVKFEAGGQEVPTSITHTVPEGAISLSASSGGPGTSLTVNGEGFKTFVPITSVKVGSIEVTPSPRPSTDANGMMSFGITIPGLDVGIQTVEVMVGQTTASTGFTVTESGVNPGDIKPVAEAVESLGDNLDVIWHFNNDSKAWTFYDGMEGSTLTHTITGETYLILVKSTVEVILNRDTRNLTCVGGNCWNQIVW